MSTAGLWDDAISRLQSIGLHWATWSVIGTFILYVLGYLTIRFHLSVLGVGTDLAGQYGPDVVPGVSASLS